MSDVGKIVVCTTLQGNKFITVGTAYEVEQELAFHYTVKNDKGVSTRYSKDCFEEIPKKADKQKIKVLCVDEMNYSYIKSGKLYDAEDYNTNYYQLKNDEGSVELYRKTCFVTCTPLTNNTFKNGDTALCIDAEHSSGLTLGKVYDVVSADGNWIEITNDSQSNSDYMFCRFVPIDNTTGKTENIKPPLGLKPRNIYWEELNYHRRQDIIAAMQRRVDAKMDIPLEWCQELIDLIVGENKC